MSEQPVARPLITLGEVAAADVCADGWCGPADATQTPAATDDGRSSLPTGDVDGDDTRLRLSPQPIAADEAAPSR